MGLFNKADTSSSSPTPAAAAVDGPAAPAPAANPFGGITEKGNGRSRNYLTAGTYRLEVMSLAGGYSKNPKTKNQPFGAAGFKVIQSEGPEAQPVGAELSWAKFFSGPGSDFRLRDWRNFVCATEGIDDAAIDWENMADLDVQEFQALCIDFAVTNPEKRYGRLVDCVVTTTSKTYDDGGTKEFTNTKFSIVEQ